jgi:uncharacterized protein YndB with AHSA1/START domain
MHEVCEVVQVPPERVWEVLSDPTTYPTWLVGAQEIRWVDPDFPAPGTEFGHEVGASDDVSVADRTTAIAVEPGRCLELEVKARPFLRGRVRFTIGSHPQGTEIRFGEEPIGPWRLLSPLLWLFVKGRNARSLHNLRELLDQRG